MANTDNIQKFIEAVDVRKELLDVTLKNIELEKHVDILITKNFQLQSMMQAMADFLLSVLEDKTDNPELKATIRAIQERKTNDYDH